MKRKMCIILSLLFLASPLTAETIVRIAPLTVKVLSSMTTVTGTAGKVPATALAGRESIALYNVDNATETVWCGDSTVTSANGFPLTSSAPAISLDLDSSVDVYCISDGTSVDVRSLESK